MQPNLVILCVRIDDMDGFQVLSMLKLDEETRSIPVLTYTDRIDERAEEDTRSEPSEAESVHRAQAARSDELNE